MVDRNIQVWSCHSSRVVCNSLLLNLHPFRVIWCDLMFLCAFSRTVLPLLYQLLCHSCNLSVNRAAVFQHTVLFSLSRTHSLCSSKSLWMRSLSRRRYQWLEGGGALALQLVYTTGLPTTRLRLSSPLLRQISTSLTLSLLSSKSTFS